ncbi:hypothetical protein B0H12DRAFT_1328099 [Mycena haematopus]|nr:hypothetical protein B0H12DRAFT_1328099 [Mycena haematopus]
MNSQFIAGASDVIECFVRELAALQNHLKEEKARAARAEAQADDEEEIGYSILWVTQTALDVTRQRLAKERAAKKVLQQEASEARSRYRVLAEGAAEKERMLEEVLAFLTMKPRPRFTLAQRVAHLQAALGELNEELRIARQDLYATRQENTKMQLELELQAQIVKAGDRDLGRELSQAHTHQKEQLSTARQQLRFALRQAAGARSIAAMTYERHNVAKRNRESAKQALKKERAAHEELKLTCRQLIDLVETLEGAAKAMESRHFHEGAECEYQKKYKRLKQRTQEREAKLAEFRAELSADVKAGRKRKANDMERQKSKRRITH